MINIIIIISISFIISIYLSLVNTAFLQEHSRKLFFRILPIHFLGTLIGTALLPLLLYIMRLDPIVDKFLLQEISSVEYWAYVCFLIIVTINYHSIYNKIYSNFFPTSINTMSSIYQSSFNKTIYKSHNLSSQINVKSYNEKSVRDKIVSYIGQFGNTLLIDRVEIYSFLSRKLQDKATKQEINTIINSLLKEGVITEFKEGMIRFFRKS